MKKLILSFFFVGLLFIFPFSLAVAQTGSAENGVLRTQLLELVQKLTAILDQLTASRVSPNVTASPVTNQPPIISGVTGPTNLIPGAIGTWQITAADPEGGKLINTVFWGDLNPPTVSSTISSFTHTYALPGAYYLTFIITDIGGKTTRANASVVVSNRTLPTVTGTARVSAVDAADGVAITTAQITVLSLTGQIIGTGNTYSGLVTFASLPAGAYTATAVAVGYTPSMATFSIVRNDETVQPVVRLSKIPIAPLVVSVTDGSTGSPLANALVTVYGSNGLPVSSRLTDSSGQINFPNLPTGSAFRIGAFLLGYTRPAQQTVTIPAGGSPADLNFVLQKTR